MPLSAARPALHRPRTLAEACELLAADERAMAYGGGTAIEVRRRQDPAFASALVDLSLIPGLDQLSGHGTVLRVGPMVTIRRMETDPLVARLAPLAAAEALMDPVPDVRGSAATSGRSGGWPRRTRCAAPGRRRPMTERSGAVGQSWPRADAEAKVRGTFRYTADEPAGRCCYVGVHRADRPHARIRSVGTGAAREISGVVAVVTGADLHAALGDRLLSGPAFADQPALAVERVRYVGEPVAAVLAWDQATARSAAGRVCVGYEHLPAVHDVDAATAAAATTVSGDFWSPPTHHVPIELPCTTAWPQDGRLELLTTTQTPSYVRQAVAEMLRLPLNRVRVRTRPLGGSFGSKMYDRLEPLVAALAWTLQLPVRMEATREEAFLLTTRHGVAVSGHMSADSAGRIVAAAADVRYDTGAYADVGPRIAAKSGMLACGPYRLDHAEIRSRCVYTNKPSAGPYRGFGVPQVTWAHESLVDELARARGEDPAAFRRRNLLRERDVAAMGTPVHSADFAGCLDAVTAAVGWDRPLARSDGPWRWGRGVAVGVKAVLTPTVANAVLQLNQDATATLLISTVEMGQGSDTVMAQIAAEVLCLRPGQVRVVAADTDVTPYDTITAGSRSTYHTGNAVRLAAQRMRDRLVGLAGRPGFPRVAPMSSRPGRRLRSGPGTLLAPGPAAAAYPFADVSGWR
jgi:CO/xanthine dehydrogenase Mo-binding subunit